MRKTAPAPHQITVAHEMPGRPIQTILVVDDQELVLRALHNYLEKRGYYVVEAQDLDKALLIMECGNDPRPGDRSRHNEDERLRTAAAAYAGAA